MFEGFHTLFCLSPCLTAACHVHVHVMYCVQFNISRLSLCCPPSGSTLGLNCQRGSRPTGLTHQIHNAQSDMQMGRYSVGGIICPARPDHLECPHPEFPALKDELSQNKQEVKGQCNTPPLPLPSSPSSSALRLIFLLCLPRLLGFKAVPQGQ